MMNGPEKSDPAIVAGKPTNKAERSAAELVEPRAGTKGNADQLSTRRTQRRISVTQGVGSHTAAYAVNTRGGRCYGASGEETASIGRLMLTERWHPSALKLTDRWSPPCESQSSTS
jgi:hypothetical protein